MDYKVVKAMLVKEKKC